MSKPPELPRIKQLKRDRAGAATSAVILWALIAAIAAAPWTLWATGILSVEDAGVLGVFLYTAGVLVGIPATQAVFTAWEAHCTLCYLRDQRDWDAHLEEQKRLQELLKKEGLA